MYILVLGTIDFPGGRKINLSANGRVDIFAGGLVTGDNGGSKLNIGGTTVWDGGDADISGPSSCVSGGCGGAPLPVELVHFQVNELGMDLSIDWTTATETNNDYFTIYLSENLTEWESAKMVSGAGTSNTPVNYGVLLSLEDLGKNRYIRLTQTDFDGNYEHIAIEKIQISEKYAGPRLRSNPSTAGFSLVNVDAGNSRIIVQSLDGAVIESRESSETRVDFEGYSPGVYLITIDGPYSTQIKAVVL